MLCVYSIFFHQAKDLQRAAVAISKANSVSSEKRAGLATNPCKTPKTRVVVTGTPAANNLRPKFSASNHRIKSEIRTYSILLFFTYHLSKHQLQQQ
jgi:hypothetical protein